MRRHFVSDLVLDVYGGPYRLVSNTSDFVTFCKGWLFKCNCCILLIIELYLFVPLSLCVRIMLLHISHTQVLPSKQNVVWSLPHWWPPYSPTFGIRAWMFSIPLPAAIRIRESQFSVVFCFESWRNREKKKKKKRGLHPIELDHFRLE